METEFTDDNNDHLSPEYRLLAAVLCSDDADSALAQAPDDVLRALVGRLKEGHIEEEFSVKSAAINAPRADLICYIEEFADKGARAMELSGESDVTLGTEPIHNLQRRTLIRNELRPDEDDKGNRVSLVQTQFQSALILNQGRRKLVQQLPSDRSHWPAMAAFFDHHAHKKHLPERIRALALLAYTLLKDDAFEYTVGDVTYKAGDLFDFATNGGRYTYYINPLATPFIIKHFEWGELLPEDRKAWPPISSFLVEHVHRSSRRENIQALSQLIDTLLKDETFEYNDGNATYKAGDLFGRYRSGSNPPTYYINPVIIPFIIKHFGWATLLPEDRKNWVPLAEFVETQARKNVSAENISHAESVIKSLLEDPSASFTIGDTVFHPEELFGYHHRSTGQSTYYINPIATALVLEKCGWVPSLPADKKHWLSSSKMAMRIQNGIEVGEYIERYDQLARKLLSQPEERINIDTDAQPDWKFPRDVVGHYKHRNTAAYLFDPSAQHYFERCVGFFRELPEDKQHFIPDGVLAQNAGFRREQAWPAIKHMARDLWRQDFLELDDGKGNVQRIEPQSVIIEVRRPSTRRTTFYVDPRIEAHYFNSEAITTAAAQLARQEPDSSRLHSLPPDKNHWKPFSYLAKQLLIPNGDPLLSVLREYCGHLVAQGNPDIAFFSSRRQLFNGGTYYASPDIVGRGKLISRQNVVNFQKTLAEQDWEPPAVSRAR